MYAAKIEQGRVSQVIVGDPAWAAERLGGVWVKSDVNPGIGWEQFEGGLRPAAPFPSWVWDEGWRAPVPYPNDGGFYEWDESLLLWATVVPISGQE